ncbi:MAG: alpha/beta fold hydrolase [Planctomycetota bacterium]
MPHLTVNDTRIWYDDSAPGDTTRPAMLFSHGLLFDVRQFDAQLQAFRDTFRVVRYDHRGQGQSDIPPGRIATIEQCTADAIALIDALGLAPCHFVGLSMGGFVALRIAARRPELLRSCIVLDSSAEPEPNRLQYRLLNLIARFIGLGMVSRKVMKILFGRTFMASAARAEEREEWHRRLRHNPRQIYKAVNGVIEREPVTAAELAAIRTATLVMVGEEDVATVPAKSERMHAAIAGSKLVRIPQAGHSSAIENPQFVNEAIREFVEGLAG